ncbi:hypothetical protein [Sphingobacterium yanglingense]|uniref:Uncharacterized protein n=1 Tax=Sphingobacterium yanglingense TaxID=1437280 RepID=A0A4V3DE49_9SPHI|nr:hypothetical protein [Sphingobacterium yanglingense]TDQ79749.1 hypothetical protein CLV99_1197 [Sphingobacterium yanglingense]
MLKNIKNYAMALGALAIAFGSLTFMSFKAAETAKIEQEYPYRFYGILGEDGESFHWQSANPVGLTCDPAPTGACSILSNSPTTPAPNAMPAPGTYIVENGAGKLYQ